MKRILIAIAAALGVGWLVASHNQAIGAEAQSKTEELLAQSAASDRHTFILFYKDNDAALQSMSRILKDGLLNRKAQASSCAVLVTDPAEQTVVKRFGVTRTPLPLVIAVAPNGAVTGIFSRKINEAGIAASFVTPAMAHCMKSMQEKKLVLICVHPTKTATLSTAVKDFQTDPHFRDRLEIISFQASDPSESQFIDQLEIEPEELKETVTVFLAPPGVMIGKYDSTATKAEMAAELHKAGKCCDDPNCKHAHESQATSKSNTKRN